MTNDIAKRLEKLQDDFQEWKKIYGEVPSGCAEPKEQAKERQAFISEIERMQNES